MTELNKLYDSVRTNAESLLASLEELDKVEGEYKRLTTTADTDGIALRQLPFVYALKKLIVISDKLSKE